MIGAHPPFHANAGVIEIDPADVFVPERIGFLHEDKAAALGRLMAVDGQRDPIKVKARKGKQPWRLVTGMHRLEGARLEGITVWAIEVFGEDDELAHLEASENLHRRPLSPLERAKFTAALVQAAQQRIAREHGDLTAQQRGAKARWDKVRSGDLRLEQALRDDADDAHDTMSQAYGWEESVGEALGVTARTIHRDLSLFRLIVEPFPELAESLSKHPVVGENAAQLKAIAGVREQGARLAVIEMLLADNELSADEARVQTGIDLPQGREATKYEKFTNQIAGAWGRFGRGDRERFVRERRIVQLLTPGLLRELRAQIDEELGE